MIGPDVPTCLALVAVGAAAGLVNTLAGGGGLLVMPLLLGIGLSPAQAIATNKLQALLGLSTAVTQFARARCVDLKFVTCVAPTAGLGAVLGALLMQRLPRELLAHMVPPLLMVAAAYALMSPQRNQPGRIRLSAAAYAISLGLALGFYDGFFGPGVGTLWLLSLMALAGQDVGKATAHANVLDLVGTAAAFAAVMSGGQMVLWAGLCLGLGQIVGAWLGARLVIGRLVRWVKPLMVLTTLGAATKLMLG